MGRTVAREITWRMDINETTVRHKTPSTFNARLSTPVHLL